MARNGASFELYDVLDDAVTVQDRSGELVYANEAAASMLGFANREALLRAQVSDVLEGFALFDEAGEPFPADQLPGRRALAGEDPPEVVVRWQRAGETGLRWSAVRARPLRDERGRVLYAINTFRDVTDQRRATREVGERARQQAVVARLGHLALTEIDLTDLMQEATRMVAETLDVELAKVLEVLPGGTTLLLRAGVGWKEGLVGEATVATRGSQAGHTLLARRPVIVDNLATETRFSGPPLLHEHGVVSGMSVVIGGVAGSFGVLGAHTPRRRAFSEDDVHFLEAIANVLATAIDRKRGDEARAELLRAEREARAQAEAARARASFLSEASVILSSSLDPEKTMQRLADLAVQRLSDWCTVDLAEDGDLRLVAIAHSDPGMVEWARDFRRRFPPRRDAEVGSPKVVRTGKPEIYREIDAELIRSAARNEEHLEEIMRIAPRSAMVVPLSARGRTFGAITFLSTGAGRRYDDEDLRLAEDLAGRAALAIDNGRLYRERSHVARTLQRSLLPPDLPSIPGIDLAARYRSADEAAEVGGDFYDVFPSAGDSWTAAMGDVCGRGIEAASLTGVVRQSLRAVVNHVSTPSDALTQLNGALRPQTSDMRFCTVALARLDRSNGTCRVTVSIGGHPPPVILRADGRVDSVGHPGTLLGVFDELELSDAEAVLEPGDALVLYTDGLTDPFEAADVPGVAGLATTLNPLAGKAAKEIAEGLERGAIEARNAPTRDDMAILVVRFAP
ncbi:MAG TPA: SpoIIE family protein phosphatase [Actinomycetota bacterium]|nr:SpoIIE family protein phosphatase [Actinomycetota bacterium]